MNARLIISLGERTSAEGSTTDLLRVTCKCALIDIVFCVCYNCNRIIQHSKCKFEGNTKNENERNAKRGIPKQAY